MLYSPNKYRETEGGKDQQNSIDRIKGIIADPMPEYWYSFSANKKHNEEIHDSDQRKLNTAILAPHKPYFMTYVYNNLKQRYTSWIRNCSHDARRKFRVKGIDDLLSLIDKTKEQETYIYYYNRGIEVGTNECVVNRICKIFEDEFPSYAGICELDSNFNYEILKCGIDYAQSDYDAISELYIQYKMELDAYRQNARLYGYDRDDERYERETFVEKFKSNCQKICPNEQELCDIVLDICYEKEYSKQFAWDIVGDVIVDNLLERNNHEISFPKPGGSEFKFNGEYFDMVTVNLEEDE